LSRYPYLYFIVARIVGLGAKPLFLLYLMSLGMDDMAADLAVVYLLLAGVCVLFSVPVHFDFYKNYFEYGKGFIGARNSFKKYIRLIVSHVYFISPVVLMLVFISVENALFAFLVYMMLLSEKIFDEIQRFLQFEKKYVEWSNAFIGKTLLPIVTAIILLDVIDFPVLEIYLFNTIICNYIVYNYYVPSFVHEIVRGSLRVRISDVKIYLNELMAANFKRFLMSVMHANILNADKWLVAFFKIKILVTELMLIAQFSNVVVVASNYAFVANRRSELLRANNDLVSLWMHFKVVIGTVLIGFVVGAGIIVSIGYNILELKMLTILPIVFIIISYAVYSITEPITEYIFWNGRIGQLILIDFFYFSIVFSVGAVILIYADFTYIPSVLLVGVILRLFMQLIMLHQLSNK